jgi:hypothetical protein
MRRKLLNVATVASLVLCLASCSVWFNGYYSPFSLFSASRVNVLAWPGSLYVEFGDSNRRRAVSAFPPLRWRTPRELVPQWVSDGVNGVLQIPYWMPVAVFAALPVSRYWRKARRQRRQELGLCVSCGYDLRATAGRCPECGGVATAPTAA